MDSARSSGLSRNAGVVCGETLLCATANRLLEDEASSPYLQRKHCVLKDTGYARAAAACAREPKGIPASVQEKMKEAFDNA